MTREQVGALQLAAWKLHFAKEHITRALGGTDVGDEYLSRIAELISDIEIDLDEVTVII